MQEIVIPIRIELTLSIKTDSDSVQSIKVEKEARLPDEKVESQVDTLHSCSLCDYTCKKEQGLKQHVTHVHGQGSIQCEDCNKYFKNRHGLFIHQSTQHREKTSLPPKIEKASAQEIRSAESKPRFEQYVCKQPGCSFSTIEAAAMTKHLSKKHQKKIDGRFLKKEVIALKNKVIICPNKTCRFRDRFVQGTGERVVVEMDKKQVGLEFCCNRCFEDWRNSKA